MTQTEKDQERDHTHLAIVRRVADPEVIEADRVRVDRDRDLWSSLRKKEFPSQDHLASKNRSRMKMDDTRAA